MNEHLICNIKAGTRINFETNFRVHQSSYALVREVVIGTTGEAEMRINVHAATGQLVHSNMWINKRWFNGCTKVEVINA